MREFLKRVDWIALFLIGCLALGAGIILINSGVIIITK